MAAFDDSLFCSENFAGKVRLFPLPNLVLFPHVMQPLHIFEQRYRELFEDALAGDGLIAMATLAPGWERNYEGRPLLYPVACLGRIIAHCQLKDGAYNVLLLGVRRVHLLGELATARRFREAKAELLDDVFAVNPAMRRKKLRRRLRDALLQALPRLPDTHEQLDELLGETVPLGMLTDVIGFLLDIDTGQKLSLLAEANVARRVELLLNYLTPPSNHFSATAMPTICFPPQFSVN